MQPIPTLPQSATRAIDMSVDAASMILQKSFEQAELRGPADYKTLLRLAKIHADITVSVYNSLMQAKNRKPCC